MGTINRKYGTAREMRGKVHGKKDERGIIRVVGGAKEDFEGRSVHEMIIQ